MQAGPVSAGSTDRRRSVTLRRFVTCILCGAVWGCVRSLPPGPSPEAEAAARALAELVPPATNLGELLNAASEGDAESERLVGFRLFYGEGAPLDRRAALYWFEMAAANGDPAAQVNMALLHELGIAAPRDRQAALRYFRMARDNPRVPEDLALPNLLGIVAAACEEPLEGGEDADAFGTFCAGCHGRLGLAAHPDAPDFARGERLEKSDVELLRTIRDGHGQMPEWSDKLPPAARLAALRYARRLQAEFRHGTIRRVRPRSGMEFRFGAADGADWDANPDPTGLPAEISVSEACARR